MSEAISKGVKKSWEDEDTARKRRTRYVCDVRPVSSKDTPENWTRYSSTKLAYNDLVGDNTESGSRHISFRGKLVEAGELEYRGYIWRAVLKSTPSDEVKVRRPVGQPPKAEPADQLVQFRCTKRERARIESAAGKQPLGSFVREVVLGAIS